MSEAVACLTGGLFPLSWGQSLHLKQYVSGPRQTTHKSVERLKLDTRMWQTIERNIKRLRTHTHLFFSCYRDRSSWSYQAIELVQEIGKRVTDITENSRELFQRLFVSMALHGVSMASFWASFRPISSPRQSFTFCLVSALGNSVYTGGIEIA